MPFKHSLCYFITNHNLKPTQDGGLSILMKDFRIPKTEYSMLWFWRTFWRTFQTKYIQLCQKRVNSVKKESKKHNKNIWYSVTSKFKYVRRCTWLLSTAKEANSADKNANTDGCIPVISAPHNFLCITKSVVWHPALHHVTDLSSVQCDGGEGQSGDMQWAVLHKTANVTHCPPKHPGAVHKSDLREHTYTAHYKMPFDHFTSIKLTY